MEICDSHVNLHECTRHNARCMFACTEAVHKIYLHVSLHNTILLYVPLKNRKQKTEKKFQISKCIWDSS